METIIFTLLVTVLSVYIIVIYNRLVADKNMVLQGWSDIDVQLKRRHELIPKLVEAVKQYADYESATLDAITNLRQRSEQAGNLKERADLESGINQSVNRLVAIAESYPDLRANESFQHLLKNISDIEEHIQLARRFYNGAVKNLNVRTESFPDMFISRLFNFKPAEYFELEN